MSTFEQAMRDPCVALPQQRLQIPAAQPRPAVLGQANNASAIVNPRECDHIYMPLQEGIVCCSICGWWWDADYEATSIR